MNIENATVTCNPNAFLYDGTAKIPQVTVTLYGVVLTENTDYTLTISNNVNVGVASVVVQGIGNYEGVRYSSFEISDYVTVLGRTDPIPLLDELFGFLSTTYSNFSMSASTRDTLYAYVGEEYAKNDNYGVFIDAKVPSANKLITANEGIKIVFFDLPDGSTYRIGGDSRRVGVWAGAYVSGMNYEVMYPSRGVGDRYVSLFIWNVLKAPPSSTDDGKAQLTNIRSKFNPPDPGPEPVGFHRDSFLKGLAVGRQLKGWATRYATI